MLFSIRFHRLPRRPRSAPFFGGFAGNQQKTFARRILLEYSEMGTTRRGFAGFHLNLAQPKAGLELILEETSPLGLREYPYQTPFRLFDPVLRPVELRRRDAELKPVGTILTL